MEKNLAKFLVPDLLRQALPILHPTSPPWSSTYCSHNALGEERGGKREGVKIQDNLLPHTGIFFA